MWFVELLAFSRRFRSVPKVDEFSSVVVGECSGEFRVEQSVGHSGESSKTSFGDIRHEISYSAISLFDTRGLERARDEPPRRAHRGRLAACSVGGAARRSAQRNGMVRIMHKHTAVSCKLIE